MQSTRLAAFPMESAWGAQASACWPAPSSRRSVLQGTELGRPLWDFATIPCYAWGARSCQVCFGDIREFESRALQLCCRKALG